MLAELLELAPGGVEEREDGDVVEYAVYGAPGELPALPDLRAAAGGALVEVSTTEVADDWAERWRAFHEPVEIGGRLWVRPPWSEPRAGPRRPRRRPRAGVRHRRAPDDAPVPGAAAATRARGRVDGPGLRLGRPLDRRREARLGPGRRRRPRGRVGRGDARQRTRQRRRGGSASPRPAPRRAGPGAPTVVANLLRPLLLRVAADGFAGAAPRTLVASGLLAHEGDEVAAAFARHGLRETRRVAGGEWIALELQRSAAR